MVRKPLSLVCRSTPVHCLISNYTCVYVIGVLIQVYLFATCNITFSYLGTMIVDKKFIPVTGGGTVKVTGPCFKPWNKRIKCKFEHTETTGKIISSDTALCPLPLYTTLGEHILWLSEDNGNTFNFYAVIYVHW